MLTQVIVGLAAVITAAQANDSFFKHFVSFDIQPDYALEGHVIKTLSQFKADCMVTCKATLSCFSINTYRDERNRSMCDLNRSTKKQSPQSFVRKEGYNYSEPSKGEFCVEDNCPTKQALPDNWYEFNSSSYKHFNNVATSWDDAQTQCQILGGELASFDSKNENDFVFETMLYDLNVTVGKKTSGELASLKFDGSDAGLNLSGAKLGTKDNKPALSTNGTGYAEIPRFDLSDTVFTFAVNIFPSTLSSQQKLLEGYSAGHSFFYFAFNDNRNNANFMLSTESRSSGSTIIRITLSGIRPGRWTQIAVTREINNGATVLKAYYNGQRLPATASSSGKFFEATDPYYRIGQGIDGWLSDMLVVSRILTLQEMNDLNSNGATAPSTTPFTQPVVLQGAWIGLNDKATEGTVQWFDGSPLTYKPNDDFDNSEQKDCGLFVKMNAGVSAWKAETCHTNAAYICKKKH